MNIKPELKPSHKKAYLWFYTILVLMPPITLLFVVFAVPGDTYGMMVGFGLLFSTLLVIAIPVFLVVTIVYILRYPTQETAFLLAQVAGIFITLFLIPATGSVVLVALLGLQYIAFFRFVSRIRPKATTQITGKELDRRVDDIATRLNYRSACRRKRLSLKEILDNFRRSLSGQ